jgi:endoglucanase
MDEIGFRVTYIDSDGFLRLHPVGGHDPRNMVAQRVLVVGSRDLPGVLYPGQKPHHLQNAGDGEKAPKAKEFFVDLGLPAEEVTAAVPIGSYVVIHRELAKIGRCYSCKAMDNRVSVYTMIEALRRAERTGFEVCAVASVQEEVGLRGAAAAAYATRPDVGLAIDVTIAADVPGIPDFERVTSLGKGAAIKIMDSMSISNPALVEALRDLAGKRNIPYQMEILPSGGTDAGAMQRARSGVPVGTLSIPTRYVHTSIETCHEDDIESAIALLTAFIEEGHRYEFMPQ